ncbi:MAG TPA: hypothetical protein VN628_17430, partial [Vicinamibacterales bacterium]|nr:hypothetical protein [Vicinamibacterales bacterium]
MAEAMIQRDRIHHRQQVFPVVAFDLGARAAAEELQLQVARVVDVHADVLQVLAEPPAHQG